MRRAEIHRFLERLLWYMLGPDEIYGKRRARLNMWTAYKYAAQAVRYERRMERYAHKAEERVRALQQAYSTEHAH